MTTEYDDAVASVDHHHQDEENPHEQGISSFTGNQQASLTQNSSFFDQSLQAPSSSHQYDRKIPL